jgi:hypothetical protein
VRYLRQQLDQLTDNGQVLAVTLGASLRKNAINNAIDDFELRACCSPVEREVHVRVAGDAGDIYVDLGDRDWHAVRITAAGWTIVQSPPVRFRRASGMQPLPFPERGTPVSALRPFLNVREDGGRDAFIAATNSHLQAFENVSRLSDALLMSCVVLRPAEECARARCAQMPMKDCSGVRAQSRSKASRTASRAQTSKIAPSAYRLIRCPVAIVQNKSWISTSSANEQAFSVRCSI